LTLRRLVLEFVSMMDGRYPNGADCLAGDQFGLDLEGPDPSTDRIGDTARWSAGLGTGALWAM
jgi:hypothetical protein